MDLKKLKHVNCLEKIFIHHPWFHIFANVISLFCRRLNTLNKCAVMKLEISPHRKRVSI